MREEDKEEKGDGGGAALQTFRGTELGVQGMHLCDISNIRLQSGFWYVTFFFVLFPHLKKHKQKSSENVLS